MKYTFPTTYGDETYLVPIDAALIPLISGSINKFQLSSVWETPEDYRQGYQAFAELQANLMAASLRDLVEGQNRLYRLLDTSLNGTQYTATGDVISPDIPAVPPSSTGAANAMRAHIGRLHQLAENAATGAAYGADSGIDGSAALDYAGSWRARLEAVQGEINAGWFGIGGQPATLADLVSSLRIGSDGDTTRITDAISAIAGDSALAQSSQAANIFGTISNLVTDTAEVGAEGAILGTLIAASIATSGMLGVLAGQLDRLIAALDGGGLVPAAPAPAGSVIGELESIKVQLQ